MAQAVIVALLRHTIGLSSEAIGAETVLRAVRQRMAQCGTSDVQTYLNRIQSSTQELHALIDEVVVPETWFFRDQIPFAYLGRYVMAEWFPSHQGGVLRVLSLACSTGEEPYSIAMALLDTGLVPQTFLIDAVDISQKALRWARGAVYGSHSFRGDDLVFRERYFERSHQGYRLCERVRDMVAFRHGNVLDARLLADREPYDAIFCRNMLIYFDEPARRRAMKVLDRLLSPGGLLFVGYAETGLFLAWGYVPVRYPRAFAYRKPGVRPERQVRPEYRPPPFHPRTAPAPPAGGSGHLSPPVSLSEARGRQGGHAAGGGLMAPRAALGELASPGDAQASALDTARRLADQGELEAAATLCESSMRAYGPSAQAYVLLGLIRQAAGNAAQAEHCFGRALYLQPDHYEALIHLALLLEHRGETAMAAVLRQRAQRARPDPR
ncbi:MAG TPA: CheR family methyltransferase [Candidatus Tectomicrobia bacterium]|nr:CheR family methyltransferase [Candidatus Tectomicrobia bacterium]